MKRKLLQLNIGASVLLVMSSCSSPTDENFYGNLEATPASEMRLDENMIPPWVDGGDSIAQVSAGPNTPVYDRNNFAIPEPGETTATSSGSVASSQNEPVIVKDAPISTDPVPLDSTPSATTPIVDTQSVVTTTTTKAKPKPKSKPKAKKKPVKRTKKTPKITKPTLLVYKVRSGDNLSLIAERCGTTVSAIRRASGIKGDTIYAGRTIKVPYTPKALRHIKSSGRSGKSSSKSSKSSSSRSSGRTYTIRSGDTISGVAARYGVSSSSILKLNGMSGADARRLRIGQKIRIPSK